ncbi:hypothetical protein GF412_04675 [Candidatus Micrarchaeota archaeon]|nr:hypothetical protein [Candidatus Micrarchaeota archaeon]MBD3418247.1 hypothetical protein [Candidatus Micrarchaeota archaeon]
MAGRQITKKMKGGKKNPAVKPRREEVLAEGPCENRISKMFDGHLEKVPISNSPYLVRRGAEQTLLGLARKWDVNPRKMDKWIRECIASEREGVELAGMKPLESWQYMLTAYFAAGLRSTKPHTNIAEFGGAYGEDTYDATASFIDMEGFSSATKSASGRTIGMLMHLQDIMFRLAGMLTGTNIDNFTGDGRNTVTIKSSVFKEMVDSVMYGLMTLSLVEEFNKVNDKTRELGMLEGKELRIRMGANHGEVSIRETSGRHTTFSGSTNLAARLMGHGESKKLVISQEMAKSVYRHFRLTRRVLGQTVMEEIEKFKKNAGMMREEYDSLPEDVSQKERKALLLSLFSETYKIQLLSDRLDEVFGSCKRKENVKWISMNDEVEDILKDGEVLGEHVLGRNDIDVMKREHREETNRNPNYARSLKPFKGFEEVSAYYTVDGMREARDNPYMFPEGSGIREKYLGKSGDSAESMESYISRAAKGHGLRVSTIPNLFFPYSVHEIDLLDGEVGSSMNRTVMSSCAFRELVEKIAAAEPEDIEGSILEELGTEMRGLGVIGDAGGINQEKMEEVEKEYILLPSLTLEIGKCRIADKMFGEPRKPGDERAAKRVARTHMVLTKNPSLMGNLLDDSQMAYLNQIPKISAEMLREHNERYGQGGGNYFEEFSDASIRVVEACGSKNKWREKLAELEGEGMENPALVLMSSQVIDGSHQLVKGIMGMPWSQTFEPVDTVLDSAHKRYEVDRYETMHREVFVVLRGLLSSKVSYRVHVDTELFPEEHS